MKKFGFPILLIAITGVLFAIFAVGNKQAEQKEPKGEQTLVRENSHRRGEGSVQIVEFGDFQCPACGAFEPVVKKVMEEYDGKVTLVWRNFPLTNIHKNAMTAALAAEAAADQGKFWEMKEKLFTNQNQWSNVPDPLEIFTTYASELALDVDKFKQSVTSKQFQERIDQDLADSEALGNSGTPTVFVGGKKAAKVDYDSLKALIEAELNK